VIVFTRRVRGTSDQVAEPARPPDSATDGVVTLVAIDDELDRLRPGLQRALGPSYRVVEGSAAPDAVAAVVPARLSRIEVLRTARPQTFILVYDEARNEPAPYLEAAADDYVAGASMAELAARIRAGLRRLGWQRTDR
jgi:hypothetical protein